MHIFIIEQVCLTSLRQRQDQGSTQELMHLVTRGFFHPWDYAKDTDDH